MPHLVLDTHLRDTDWEALYTIFIKCFSFSSGSTLACFHPQGLDPAHLAANIRLFKARNFDFDRPIERAAACIRARINDPLSTTTTTAATTTTVDDDDSSSSNAIAFISCAVYRDQRGITAQPPPQPPIQLPQLSDPREREYWEWFRTELETRERESEALHRPVMVIQALAVDPAWRRRGAARTLLEWAFDFASTSTTTTEASASARGGLRVAVHPGAMALEIGFYERFGFRVVGDAGENEMTIENRERFPDRDGVDLPLMIRDC